MSCVDESTAALIIEFGFKNSFLGFITLCPSYIVFPVVDLSNNNVYVNRRLL